MCLMMIEALEGWRDDDDVKAIVVDGAGIGSAMAASEPGSTRVTTVESARLARCSPSLP